MGSHADRGTASLRRVNPSGASIPDPDGARAGPLVALLIGLGLEDGLFHLVGGHPKRRRPRPEQLEVTAVGARRPGAGRRKEMPTC